MSQKVIEIKGFSLERLHTLVLLAEHGTLAKAAKGKQSQQAQYSKQIGELEKHFETELVRRKGNRLELTANGQHLVEIAREVFMRLEGFHTVCGEDPLEVTIASGIALLGWLFIPQLTTIKPRLPNTNLKLLNYRTADIIDGLKELRIDVGVVRESSVKGVLKKKQIGTLRYALFAPKSLLVEHHGKDVREHLQRLPLALVSGDGEFKQKLRRAGKAEGIHFNCTLECDSFAHNCQAVKTGRYAAILPTIAKADLDQDHFTEIPLPMLKTLERKICLAWNPRAMGIKPQLEQVIKVLAKELT